MRRSSAQRSAAGLQTLAARGLLRPLPRRSAEFEDLRDAISKLALNDASFSHEMETSAALGFGFRCGFLGLLHLEVIRDRLEREYDIELITTAPVGHLPRLQNRR